MGLIASTYVYLLLQRPHDDSVEFGMATRTNCVTYAFSNGVLQREGTGTWAALRMGARGRGVRQVGISWVGICRCHC
jgi:hypothetical protein